MSPFIKPSKYNNNSEFTSSIKLGKFLSLELEIMEIGKFNQNNSEQLLDVLM